LTLAVLLLAGWCAPAAAEPPKKGDDNPPRPASVSADPKDWSMYNYDVAGTRHNVGERALGKDNVARLEEKWRFPPKGSKEAIGVIHATPVVVDGCVYFGTANDSAFYKLGPDGKLKWTYRNPTRKAARPEPPRGDDLSREARFQPSLEGVFTSALVTGDTVFFGDLGGWFYALDRETGAERWKLNARAKDFPGSHPLNWFFSSPILAGGKVVVGGGTAEQVLANVPFFPGCSGRGFVVALEPKDGKVAWKYDVGPRPEPLEPPVTIKDALGEHVFRVGPATSSVWCTPSYDADSQTVFFGTDTDNAPRRPTKDDPRLCTKHSCAVIAVDAGTGKEKWVTQISPDDVWNYALCLYDPKTGRHKDQSIGDTPKLYTIEVSGKPRKVVGAGCKNGAFYVLDAATGELLRQTPVYKGPPTDPREKLDPRTLALPGAIGGLQTGCATDGKAVYTNGIDIMRFATSEDPKERFQPPTGGRVVSISPDARAENWRHERPKVKAVGGAAEKPLFTDVGDPVGSGIALANGVAYFTTTVSNRLVALDTATGRVLKELDLGPVWSGPSVSRGRIYVGTGNILFAPGNPKEAYFPKGLVGTLYSYGLPGEDEVSRLGGGKD
jgi:glucose dehydrogenase